MHVEEKGWFRLLCSEKRKLGKNLACGLGILPVLRSIFFGVVR
jgi:hypothetical protein